MLVDVDVGVVEVLVLVSVVVVLVEVGVVLETGKMSPRRKRSPHVSKTRDRPALNS